MKQIKTARLFFKEGKSDKVYEVDLCELDAEQFVVNFAYGRRGNTLREGTKTVFPVVYDEALKIFDALVLSKTKKGYLEEGTVVEEISTPIPETGSTDERADAVLAYLKKGDNNPKGKWSLSRAIWRAGELNIKQAEDLLIGFLNQKDPMEVYAAVWSLGRIQSEKSVDPLISKLSSWTVKEKAFRLGLGHVLKHGSESQKQMTLGIVLRTWPSELVSAVSENNDIALRDLVQQYSNTASGDWPYIMSELYLVSIYKTWIRPIILNYVKSIEFKPGYFKGIRYIYKSAELLMDSEMITTLSKRVYYSSAYYRASYYGVWLDGATVKEDTESKKHNSRLAFSNKTKAYFERRATKYIKRLVGYSNQSYVEQAKAYLMSADEAKDNLSLRKEMDYEYDYNTWSYVDKGVKFFPAYSQYGVLMYIIYGNSSKYNFTGSGSWYLKDANPKAEFSDHGREEAFPYIWNESPKEIIEILIGSKSEMVSNFAVRVYNANPSFKEAVSTEQLIEILKHDHKDTSAIGVDIAKALIEAGKVTEELVFALLSSKNIEGEQIGLTAFDQVKIAFEKDNQYFIKALQSGNTFLLNTFITKIKEVKLSTAQFAKMSLVDFNSFLTNPNAYSLEFLNLVVSGLEVQSIGQLFAELKISEIELFVKSEIDSQVMLGLKFIQINAMPSHELAGSFILDMVASPKLVVQTAAIGLLIDFPESFFADKKDLIISLSFSEIEGVRNATSPVLLKLVNSDPTFKAQLFKKLILAITVKEAGEGIHEAIKNWLNQKMSTELLTINKDSVFELLFSPYEMAQHLGTKLFNDNHQVALLSNEEIVMLASVDTLSIRKEVHQFLEDSKLKVNAELEAFLGVLESNWDTTRSWAFNYFMDNINVENWGIELLMVVCDSPLHDVQAFGRKLITKVFKSDFGLQLLLQLSEHPTDEMKLFTTNYLASFAAGNFEIIQKLKPFFLTVLLSVNKNGVAKKRVLAFLKQEADQSLEVAQFTLEIVKDLMASNTKSDLSAYMSLLLEIKDNHPTVELPFEIIPTKIYTHAV